MRRSADLVIALATFVLPVHASDPPFSWSNPLPFELLRGPTAPRREIRDPCIVREGDRYWLVFTMCPFRGREGAQLSEPDAGGSPGIALYSSPDRELAREVLGPARRLSLQAPVLGGR